MCIGSGLYDTVLHGIVLDHFITKVYGETSSICTFSDHEGGIQF